MLYQDADDPVLEQDIFMDLNEAEQVGSNQQVNIVAQIDRYAGGYQGDGDWSNTRRYYMTKDNDLFHIHSKMVADLGEVSMADPKTLVDFATWAIKTYPADKYVLILSDHGMGWPGGWTDPKPGTLRSGNLPFAQAVSGNMIYTNEIDQALGQIRSQTGLDRFELVGLDACLMSQLEVYSALAPHTRFVVTSQETEPALGWAYSSFLKSLEDNPGMDGAELGSQIVSSFIKKDQRILDSQARIDFLRQGSPLGGMFGRASDMDPTQLSTQIEKSVTLSVANMDALPGLMNSLNQLAFALQKEDQSVVSRAKTYAQSFTSIFGKDVPPSYIDLGSFAQLLQQQSSSSAVKQRSRRGPGPDQAGGDRRNARAGKIRLDRHRHLLPQLTAVPECPGRRAHLYHGRQPVCQGFAVGRFPGILLHQLILQDRLGQRGRAWREHPRGLARGRRA